MKVSEEVEDKQASVGLPREPLRDIALLYDAASQTIVLCCSVQRLGTKIPLVFVRKETTQYESVERCLEDWRHARYSGLQQQPIEIGMHTPMIGINSWLFFLVNEVTKLGDRVGGNVVGVARVDLATMACDVWDTRVPASETSCEATRLIGVDASGAVYAVAGFPSRRADGSGYSVSYGIARLQFAERVVERMLSLPNVFY